MGKIRRKITRERTRTVGQGPDTQGTLGLGSWGFGHGLYDHILENVDKLRGPGAMAIWSRMRNHARISAVLRSVDLPIRRATWTIEPPDDPKEVEIKRAQMLSRAYFKNMRTPWDSVVSAGLLMLPYGFSMTENTVRVGEKGDEKGLWLPDTMQLRQPFSIVDAKIVDNEPAEFKQWTSKGDKIIKREYCSLYTNGILQGWRGESILRAAYPSWFMYDMLMRILGIAHERWSAGIPIGYAPDDATEDELDKFDEELEELGGDEKGYLRIPTEWEVKMMEGMRRPMDPLAAMEFFGDEMARSALAQHLTLGGSASGSRALGVAFLNSFVESLQAYADYEAEVLSRDSLYIITESNWGTGRRYSFRVSDVHGTLLRDLAYAAQAGLLAQDDPDVNEWVKRRIGVPITGSNNREGDPSRANGADGGGDSGRRRRDGSGSADDNNGPENNNVETLVQSMTRAGITVKQIQEYLDEND